MAAEAILWSAHPGSPAIAGFGGMELRPDDHELRYAPGTGYVAGGDHVEEWFRNIPFQSRGDECRAASARLLERC